MDEFSKHQDAGGGEAEVTVDRARDSLLLTANLRVVGLASPVPARVRNLSTGGLMAEYAGPARTGDPIAVEVRGIGWVNGEVAWVTDGRIGIAFLVPIDPLLARKPVGRVAAPQKKRAAPL